MLEWSVAVSAAAFIAVAIVAMIVLISLKRAIGQAQETLQHLQKEAGMLRDEASQFLQDTRRTANMLEGQLSSVEPFASSIRQAGDAVQHVTSSITSVTNALTESAVNHIHRAHANNSDRIGDVFDLVDIGLGLWEKWYVMRHAADSRSSTKPHDHLDDAN